MSQFEENREIGTAEGFDGMEEGGGLYGENAVDAFESLLDDGEPDAGEAENPEPGEKHEAQDGEAGKAADYPMPEGWEETMWQALQPDVRGKVDALIKSHAEAVSRHTGEMDALRNQTAQTMAKANADAQRLLDFAREVIEGEFRNVDWQELRQNPELFRQAQGLFHGRRAALAQLQAQVNAGRQAMEQQAMAQAKTALASEWAATEPKLKALLGAEYSADGYKASMREYLKKSGASDAEIAGIGRGYMLEIATKAMLYDKNLDALKAASAKVAGAPKVQAPRGAGSADDGDALAKARARLSRNPDSLEAQIGLFEALY